MTKNAGAFIFVVLLSTISAYGEICDIGNYVTDFKGNPVEITEYTEELADSGGTLTAKNRTITQKMLFDYTSKKIELVLYNALGNPYRFIQIKYLENKKIATMIEKGIDYKNTSEFVYKAPSGNWEMYMLDEAGKKQKMGTFTKDKEKGRPVSVYKTETGYGVVKKVYLDNGAEGLVFTYRYGAIHSLVKNEYGDKKKSSVGYDSKGDFSFSFEELYDVSGNPLAYKSKTSYSEENLVYEYMYDTMGNWIQKDQFEQKTAFDGLYPTPVTRTIREILYKRTAVAAKTIEPDRFYTIYEMLDEESETTDPETDNSQKYYRNLYVYESIDPIDDKQITSITFKGIGGGNSYDGTPSLVIRRKVGEEPEIYISWKEYLGLKSLVTLRIGEEEAKTSEWNLSTNSKATFYTDDPFVLIESMRSVDRVIAQTTPYGSSPMTTTFDVSELKELEKKHEWIFTATNGEESENDK